MSVDKYKKGDKVRIVSKWRGCRPDGGKRDKWLGKVMTVLAKKSLYYQMVEDQGECRFSPGNDGWCWHDEEIECLAEGGVPGVFNRDDIKAGYLLEVKFDGDIETFYMTVGHAKYGAPEELGCCCPVKEWWPLHNFDRDTLIYEGLRSAKILRVYGPTSNRLLLANTPEERTLLWERQEEPKVVEMTVAEISEKLGYEVKVVKEH